MSPIPLHSRTPLILLVTLMICFSFPGVSLAASKEELATTGAAVSQVLEDRAREALGRYISQKDFDVNVTVVPSKALTGGSAYQPRKISTSAIASMSQDELAAYIKSVRVQVLLTSRLIKSRKQLEEIVFKNLHLQRGRDAISFGKLGIESQDDEWTKERNDLKQQISQLESDKEKLQTDLQAAKTALETQSIDMKNDHHDQSATQPPPDHFWEDAWQAHSVGIFTGLIILLITFILVSVGLLVMGRSLSTAGRNMGGAISAVAQAMENVGGSIVSSVNMSGTLGAANRTEIEQNKMLGGGEDRRRASLPIESIHTHLLKIRAEIVDTLNDSTESIILRHLTQLCSGPATVAKAVVLMELLGKEKSTDLFKRLGVSVQESMLRFLREGTYDRSKVELMMEAGEELKTKLLEDSFDRARGKPSEKVAEKILQVSDEDLAQVVCEIDTDALPRLFLYLDPNKIATVLAQVKALDSKRYEKAILMLPKMPSVENVAESDPTILQTLEAVLERTKSDAQRPFLKVYQDIVESAGDELGEDIMQQLSADPRVDTFLKQNVIGIYTFFLLEDEVKAELLEPLSNRDIAALSAGVKEDERNIISALLPERRRPLVAEEVEALTSRGSRQVSVQFKRVKEMLVRRLRDLKADGTLQSSLRSGGKQATKAPAPETPATTLAAEAVVSDSTGSAEEAEATSNPDDPDQKKVA